MTASLNIRLATPDDAAALAAIYAQYIPYPVSFEYTAPDASEFQKRIEVIYRDYPYLVCVDGGVPIAYAYAHKYKERAAYQWDAELSVYIDSTRTAKGLGRIMCLTLLDILTVQGVKNVYCLIVGSNEKSKHLHLKLGFEPVAVYKNTGFKNGQWLDIACYEKQLNAYDIPPKPVIPVRDLDKDVLSEILSRYTG